MSNARTITYDRQDTGTVGTLTLVVTQLQEGEQILCNIDNLVVLSTGAFIAVVNQFHGINDTKPHKDGVSFEGMLGCIKGGYKFDIEWDVKNAPPSCVGFAPDLVKKVLIDALMDFFRNYPLDHMRTSYF